MTNAIFLVLPLENRFKPRSPYFHRCKTVRNEDRREGLLDREAALAPLNLGSDPFNTEAK